LKRFTTHAFGEKTIATGSRQAQKTIGSAEKKESSVVTTEQSIEGKVVD